MNMNRRFFLSGAAASLGVLANPLRGRELGRINAINDRVGAAPLLFGVDYYPDQTPESLWMEDAQMMAAIGLTNVRVAEFAWGLMEPSEGKFDFAWLHRSVEMLEKAGLGVILGTPSAAPPPWLTQKFPEVMLVTSTGMTLSPEGRRFTCPTNKVYRDLSLKMAIAMARSFADTSGVLGWQIDNELTLSEYPRCYCKYCRAGFQEWLRAKYGTLEKLNSAWGTVFWSQTYTDFEQVPVPLPSGGPPNPGMALDYDRYQSYANVSFLDLQLAALRKYCPQHFVTTNSVAGVDTIILSDLYAGLDFVSTDNYPGFVAIYAMGADGGAAVPSEFIASSTSWSLDMTRGAKDGKPFVVMEQQSGKAGQTFFSAQPEKGQLRLWSYQTVAHGAMGINYFRWDSATFGAEEYWHGLLNHDRSKSAGFAEIVATVKELTGLGEEALHADYLANAALIFDYNSDWAMAIQPSQPKLKYIREIMTWYGVAAAGGALMDIVDGSKDLSKYKIVFAPLLYVVSEKQAQRIEEYVQGGGVFVGNYRLGVKDEHGQIVKTPLPGLLRKVMGAVVEEYVPIYSGKQGVRFGTMFKGPEGECDVWADVLRAEGAQVVATYTTGEHIGKAAVTMNAFGRGKAIYVGAHLDAPSLGRVLITLERMAGMVPEIPAPPGVEVTMRKSGAMRWIYVLNHTGRAQSLELEKSYKNARSGEAVQGKIVVEAYGATVLTGA